MSQLIDNFGLIGERKLFTLHKKIVKNGKTTKIPISPHTLTYYVKHSKWMDSPNVNCATLTECLTILSGLPSNYGISFLIIKDDHWFIDIDNCVNSDGSWSKTATEICGKLSGAFMEISQSKSGLHIVGSGSCEPHSCKNLSINAELYTEKRLVALTGFSACGNVNYRNEAAINSIIKSFFEVKNNTLNGNVEWTTVSTSTYNAFDNDDELLLKALASKSKASAFTGSLRFKDLWECDSDKIGQTFPAHEEGKFDASHADASLAQHLMFWTGLNCDHTYKLMWGSKLRRDKWLRSDYMMSTILNALKMSNSFYEGNRKSSITSIQPPQPIVKEPIKKLGYQFLDVDQQLNFFKDCVYIQSLHQILTPRDGTLKKDVFNVVYGGYSFQMDDGTSSKITKKAWECFTESQAVNFPKVAGTCFRPNLPPNSIVSIDGLNHVNTFAGINTPSEFGDVAPFTDFMKRLLPDVRDREILTCYMSAIVQYPGIKFKWAPLIQGVQGNGKSLISSCVTEAVGERYTHSPMADQISEKYNAWMFDKIFISVEDIYVPGHREDVMEILKPMITSTRHAKRDMGVGQIMQDSCANFIFNSNHKGALRTGKNGRRLTTFYTAQQSKEDLEDYAMSGDYFPKLYDWLRSGGYKFVTYYLQNYKIVDKYNPATECHRAPTTSTSESAIDYSLGVIEQEVLEAVDQQIPGFCGGWISSIAFDNLLKYLNMSGKVSYNKRREILYSLDYEWHPNLHKGRVTKHLISDNGKPKLYIKIGHIHRNLTLPGDISHCYEKAQGSVSIVNKYTVRNR